MKKILSIAVLLFFGFQFAQAQPYSPDRPGIGTGSFTLPENMVGLEAGVSNSFTPLRDQVNVGQFLLRYGLSEPLELRMNFGSYSSGEQELIGGSRNIDGIQDMSVGVKYNVFNDPGKTNISALANVSLPVGSEEFTTDEFVPLVAVLADFTLQSNWSVSSNLGYSLGLGNVEDFLLFTVTPGFSITDNLGGFIGYAGQFYGSSGTQHWVEGAITFNLNNIGQLDLNIGLETEGDAGFIGLGYAQGF